MDESQDSQQPSAEGAGKAGDKPKVLVIEDDVFMASLLIEELQHGGFEVAIANNGEDGIKQYSEFTPDVLLLDLLLPDMKGFDVLRKIRVLPNGDDAKVLVFSNIAEEVDQAESEELKVIDHLVKANNSLPEVVQKVRDALQ